MTNLKKRIILLLLSCIALTAAVLLYQGQSTGLRESREFENLQSEAAGRESIIEGRPEFPVIEGETSENENFNDEASETETSEMEAFETEAFETETFENETQSEAPQSGGAFYYVPLTDGIKQRITGKSYPDTQELIQISYEDLAYVHVLHYDFDGQTQEGELVCNQAIAQDLVEIFTELYKNQYPIEKIRLIDEYDADDDASMADNNTSCFNYRTVPGKTKLSNHSYGRAIDVNPLYNPYVRTKDGKTLISPENGAAYADRGADFPHKIDKEDLCYKLFMEHGFSWGGAWNSSKDYQHFEK